MPIAEIRVRKVFFPAHLVDVLPCRVRGNRPFTRGHHELAEWAGAHIAYRIEPRNRCLHPLVGLDVAPIIEGQVHSLDQLRL